MSESAVAGGTLLDLPGEEVIQGARLALGDCPVPLRLHAGPGQREHNVFDMMLVHHCEASLAEVHQRTGGKLSDIAVDVRVSLCEVLHEIGNHEVLFHRDLAELLGIGSLRFGDRGR